MKMKMMMKCRSGKDDDDFFIPSLRGQRISKRIRSGAD